LTKELRQPGKSLLESTRTDDLPTGSLVRVLVVEDHEQFRRFLCSTLRATPGLQIIHEASDGLEAVQKAAELRPDLILLDIGLPRLNGMEAGRRIRELFPESKILFVSQESSVDIVHEALSIGAGYVSKIYAAEDLPLAVDAVLGNESFVSSTLLGVNSRPYPPCSQ
jgi:DNA-binding NarL/FixJ family response regulator